MPFRRWKTLTSKILHKNPWWTYKLDTFEVPNGYKGEYHYVHTEGASMVVPVLDDGKVVLVNQYRYLRDMPSLEFPCGGVKKGHTYEETADLELAEEAGFKARHKELIGEFNPYNGITDEVCRVYVARELKRIEKKPDVTEEFEEMHLTPREVDLKIEKGEIWDGMTLAAWAIARRRLV
ncbi:MAG: NUDIX hydrolase [Bacteroidota bacterium]